MIHWALSVLTAAAEPAPWTWQATSAGADATLVEQIERQLVAAIAALDMAVYDRIVADDYVVVRPDGSEMTKAQVMAAYRSGEQGYTDLAIDEVRVHVFGDTAILSARTSGLRREKGADVPNRVRYLRVFARRDGRWRPVARMAAPLPAP
jgi:ketosteroid isomerase-like protein